MVTTKGANFLPGEDADIVNGRPKTPVTEGDMESPSDSDLADQYDYNQPSGNGSTGTGSGTSDSTPSGATNEAKFKGLGGNPELWKNGDDYYMVYYAPGPFEPPIATMWRVPDEETLKAFGGGEIPEVDKTVTDQDIEDTGSIIFGTTNELPDAELDPWTGFKERIARASEVQPWLADPEVYAIIGAAYVEGRPVEDWELQATDWWQDRNTGQRAWAEMNMADPTTAEQKIESDKIQVNSMFESIGAVGNDQALVDFMSLQYTIGNWDDKKLAQQIEAVTSGWGDIDETVTAFLESNSVTAVTSADKTEEVRNMFNRWLGPAYPPSDAQISEWATKLRNDPSAMENLTGSLRSQRMALYPAYADENLTYEDIASPWRSVVSRIWGETADETSDTFQEIVNMNSVTDAGQLLRRKGLAEGKEKVVMDAAMAASSATGGSVRSAI